MLQRCVVLKIVVANRLAQNNGKASLYKKVCCMFKVLFLANYTSIIVVFYRSFVFTEFLVLHDFIFSWTIYKLYKY